MLKTTFSFLLAMLVFITFSRGQSVYPQVLNVSGNSYTHGQYAIDWSIGELAIVETFQPSNFFVMLTNGLLQPHTNRGSVNTTPAFGTGEIIILPNPTRGKLEINLHTRQAGDINMMMYDANGKQVYRNSIQSNGLDFIVNVDLSQHAAGAYFLYVTLDPYPGSIRKHGAFKIIKAD